jgi:hypothetical protein
MMAATEYKGFRVMAEPYDASLMDSNGLQLDTRSIEPNWWRSTKNGSENRYCFDDCGRLRF